ncbi:MAG: hypothetical protein H6Q60_773 [Oscillospiraceae bacterium]|nr:hypothetical protein [Oscillospiraceae bacterium]
MVKVIMGLKGSGKTKQMIDLINQAVSTENGYVVAIERGPKLIYDVHHNIRLVDANEFDLSSFDVLKGFIAGLYASNFDITHVFIDSLSKIVPVEPGPEVEVFLKWLETFSETNNIKFTVTISADQSQAREGVRRYF